VKSSKRSCCWIADAFELIAKPKPDVAKKGARLTSPLLVSEAYGQVEREGQGTPGASTRAMVALGTFLVSMLVVPNCVSCVL